MAGRCQQPNPQADRGCQDRSHGQELRPCNRHRRRSEQRRYEPMAVPQAGLRGDHDDVGGEDHLDRLDRPNHEQLATDQQSATYHQRISRDLTRPGRCDPTRWVLIGLHRRLTEAVEALPPGRLVVDFGCGLSPYRGLFQRRFASYLAIDLPGNPLADATLGPEGGMPLESNAADCVLSSQVLEHVADPTAYLAEAFRVLRPRGHLVLSTHGHWTYHPDPTDYWRWTRDGLTRTIEHGGFTVKTVTSVLSLPSVALQFWLNSTYRRMPRRLQPVYAWCVQMCIGWIERARREEFSLDAADFVVVAQKPERG